MRNVIIVATLVALGCGGQSEGTKPKQASTEPSNPEMPPSDNPVDADAGAAKSDDSAPKKDPCVGFDVDLGSVLMQAACEVPNPKPDAKPMDTKGKLAITLAPASATVSPGGHTDLVLTLANKTSSPLPLFFTLDPTPRFPTETYNKKKKRVDMPPGNPPKLPKGVPPREATSHETARITLVPNGTAKLTVPWNAVRMRWAPEKLKGTPPEEGYPRAPNGPLARGTYTVRVAMPLVGVFEGSEREVSAPSTTISVK